MKNYVKKYIETLLCTCEMKTKNDLYEHYTQLMIKWDQYIAKRHKNIYLILNGMIV